MANVTLTLDDDLLRRARIRALEQGTSVNGLVREYLQSFAGESPASQALAEFLSATEQTRATSGSAGRGWTRDELYER